MPRNSIGEYSTTPGDNTDIGGINIAEGMAPSDVNNAMRELLSQLKKFQTGAGGDTISPPVLIATTATLGTATVTGAATFNSAVVMSSNLTLNAQSDIRLADSDSSNWVAFQAPATVASNVTWTLPNADGTSGQVLSTNGSGTLSWASGGGSSISAGDSKVEVTDTGSDGKITGTADNTAVFSVEKGKTFVLEGGSSSTGVGVAFPATQVGSTNANTLDDYEEGSFSPTITFGGASAGITYNTTFTEATYTKIGNRVFVSGYLVLTNKGSSTGFASIGNLPFTSASGNTRYLGASIGGGGFTFANQFFAWIVPGNTIIQVGQVTEAGNRTDLTNSNFTNSTDIFFTAHYTV